MNSSFHFLTSDDSTEQIIFDLNSLLSSDEWVSMVSSLVNEGQNEQNAISLTSLVERLSHRLIDSKYPFIKYDPSILVNAFSKEPNIMFLSQALTLPPCDLCLSTPFVEKLVKSNPRLLISLQLQTILPSSQQSILCSIAFNVAQITKENSICDFCISFGPSIFMDVLFSKLSAKNDAFCSEMLRKTLYFWKSYDILKKYCLISINNRNDFMLNFILSFLVKFGNTDFIYSDVFQKLFGNVSSPFLVDVLISMATSTPPEMLQTQIHTLPPKYTGPLRVAAQKIAPKQSISATQLKIYAKHFVQRKEIPSVLCQLSIIDKATLIDEVGPALEMLSTSDESCFLLLEEMKKKKMIVKKRDNPLLLLKTRDGHYEQIVEFIEERMIKGDEFATDLFTSFNTALNNRHKNDTKDFMLTFNDKVIKALSLKVQLSLAESVATKICTDIDQDELMALATLAVRLPMTKFINRTFSKNPTHEINILAALHKASLETANIVKLPETFPDDDNERNVASLDKSVILRLRWRNLRGDPNCEDATLPLFMNLVEDDRKLYFEWEISQNLPLDRSGIIDKLKIEGTSENLYSLLKCQDVDDNILQILIPLFNSVKELIIPADVNFKVVYKFPFIWNPKILSNASFQKHLRECSLECAQALIEFMPDNFRELIETFPSVFSCIISNAPPLVLHNDLLNEGSRVIQGGVSSDILDDFFVYGCSFVMFRRSVEFPPLLQWKSAELFFSICGKQFERSIKILEEHNELCQTLLRGMKNDGILCEKGDWISNLVRFAVFCSREDYRFENEDWKKFIKSVIFVDWPEDLMIDCEIFVIFNNYQKDLLNEE